jgi:hypothetical protein
MPDSPDPSPVPFQPIFCIIWWPLLLESSFCWEPKPAYSEPRPPNASGEGLRRFRNPGGDSDPSLRSPGLLRDREPKPVGDGDRLSERCRFESVRGLRVVAPYSGVDSRDRDRVLERDRDLDLDLERERDM